MRMRTFWIRSGVAAITVFATGVATGLTLVGQAPPDEEAALQEDAGAAATNAAPTRSGVKPRTIRQQERDQLEEESAGRNAIGNDIEQQMERAADAGEDLSFEEARRNAEARLFQASASYAPSGEGATGYPNPDMISRQGENQAQQRVCFQSDGSVTMNREECDTDQSGHFGFDTESDPASTAWRGYDVPSYDDVSGYMNRQFSAPVPSYGPAMHDQAQTIGMTPPSQMTFILQMMDTIMNEKLPKVFALFEGAGLNAKEPRAIFQRAASLFNELKGPCAAGAMDSCFRLSGVADIMMGMRPIMEKAIMESGNWQIGMQIGQIMEGVGPPPGGGMNRYGPPSGMMPGGYGPPPGMNGGFGPSPGTMDGGSGNGF